MLLVFLFLFATVLNIYRDEGQLQIPADPHYLVSPTIAVIIKGAVRNPGVYQVAKGSTLLDAIEMAEPLQNANLKTFKAGSKINRKRTITVKKIQAQKK